MNDRYEKIADYSQDRIVALLEAGDPEQLRVMVVGVAYYHPDGQLVEEVCQRLATHDHEIVRGNAVLGFGHLARRFRQLDEPTVRPLIEQGLVDPSAYVRGQAHAAAQDAQHFLGWKFADLE